MQRGNETSQEVSKKGQEDVTLSLNLGVRMKKMNFWHSQEITQDFSH